jgi:RNA polymerase sigma factor for flagellar operon FliA
VETKAFAASLEAPQGSMPNLAQLLPDPGPSPSARGHARDKQQVLNDALAALPDHLREVIKLSYDEEKSAEAIAERLGVDRRTISRWLGHARKALREYLQRRGIDGP